LTGKEMNTVTLCPKPALNGWNALTKMPPWLNTISKAFRENLKFMIPTRIKGGKALSYFKDYP
jgi:hypothetical protein